MSGTNGLGSRLRALEVRAHDEQTRRRADRLAQRHGLDPARLLAEVQEAEAAVAQLKAAGATERQIVEHLAAGLGVTPDELEREAERIAQEGDDDD